MVLYYIEMLSECFKGTKYTLCDHILSFLKVKMRVTLKREILWVTTFHRLYEEYGQMFLDWYFRPNITEYGIPTFVSFNPSVKESNRFDSLSKGLETETFRAFEFEMKELQRKLENEGGYKSVPLEDLQLYFTILKNALEKTKVKVKPGKEQYALARYEVLKVLDNGVTWSVLPEYKKRWKIDQELFGAFYNTSGKFCSLFPELEGCGCQFGTFNPLAKGSKRSKHYLVNPPFEKYYIKWACKKVLEWLQSLQSQKPKKKVKFTVIVPVWDPESRKELKLKPYGPLQELTDLLESEFVINHTMTQMKFWDGSKQKVQKQKSYIHMIQLLS